MITKSDDYRKTYFAIQPKDTWLTIKSLPPVIGIAGFAEALHNQPLMPEYRIVAGHYFATYRIETQHTQQKRMVL